MEFRVLLRAIKWGEWVDAPKHMDHGGPKAKSMAEMTSFPTETDPKTTGGGLPWPLALSRTCTQLLPNFYSISPLVPYLPRPPSSSC